MKFKELSDTLETSDEGHLLLEMAKITNPSDNVPRGGSIYIYGSGDDKKGEHGDPHFHLFTSSENIESIAVEIETMRPTGLFRPAKGVRSVRIRKLDSWTGYGDFKKFLEKWLPMESSDIKGKSNLQIIRIFWNKSNPGLRQVDVAGLGGVVKSNRRKTI